MQNNEYTEKDREALLALSLLPGMTRALLARLIGVKEPESRREESVPGQLTFLADLPGKGGGLLSPSQLLEATEKDIRQYAGRLLRPEAAERAASAIAGGRRRMPKVTAETLRAQGICFVTITEKSYPEKLRQIPDPPLVLYYRGSLPKDERPSVAVIGARLATPYGSKEARRFSGALAKAGVQIISGMARGIDGIAGRAALEQGTSFAVLGGGVDIVYPPENRDLYEALVSGGGILSEYAPGTRPQARMFPPRNRIISGLSDIVLVVEARKKSGTMITVDMALEQGREVFAVPGRNTDVTSGGCNSLIDQGSGIAVSPDQILHALAAAGRYRMSSGGGINGETGGKMREAAAQDEKRSQRMTLSQAVLSALSATDLLTPEDLLPQVRDFTGEEASPAAVRAALFSLQLAGLAAEEGTGFFRRAAD